MSRRRYGVPITQNKCNVTPDTYYGGSMGSAFPNICYNAPRTNVGTVRIDIDGGER